MTSPTPTPTPTPAQNPTSHVQALLEAAIALGGTVETTRTNSCFTSTCSYGTPSYRSFYSPEEKRWVRQGPVDDVTMHRISWPLHTPKDRCWERITTGPTAFELAKAIGMKSPYADRADGQFDSRAEAGIYELVIYEHDTITAQNGSGGRGIVIAVIGRPSVAGISDQRNCWHFVTDAAGELGLGMFAT